MNKLLLGLICCFYFTLEAQLVIDQSLFKELKFRNIGPAGMSGRITAIDVDLANENRIFVGAASGGVWLSENGGISWKPVFDDVNTLAIGSIKINQKNPSEIWVGTGEGNPRNSMNTGQGIYKSLDGGKTWKCMGLENTKTIHRIIINNLNSDIVYAGAMGTPWASNPDRGIFKTKDGGKTWNKILYVDENTGLADMVVDPTNPNKIIAAMWEYSRKPWFFNSGGKGSSLHITYDGGETWTKITDKEGLPKGELGRIGIAIAPSKTNIVYALVEAKTNGLYKSTDGGRNWALVSEKNIGDRPFYYSEIYVDPKNENRIFNLYTFVSMSEDGGKTFRDITGYFNNVHPDNHAWWIHPENPSFMINGNDGGCNISRDGGASWAFVGNLPVGQFYHVNIDNDFPYNVYGGMQDNGSWIGPSSVLKSGLIRNNDFQELYFGDGFDVVPFRSDSRFGYAMSQQGELGFYDRKTGFIKSAKPVRPDTTNLRFNWNTAIAQDPFNDCGVYFGSQYVHYSSDCGESWFNISGDLTYNDPSKHKQGNSGGLTLDATGAENYNTIMAIAPSPVDKNVIWVGTDDGLVQLTQDGGKSWNKVSSMMPGLPDQAWVPQIEVSSKNAGEAFVVVNNYRKNDYSAYAYYTKDFGKSWTRIVDDSKVKGFTLSIVQDPVESNLLFLGTDIGLYISFDFGKNWILWTEGFPHVQVNDMKIHPKEHDLVLGTFGRALWILDDINPLRELARDNKVLEKDLKMFPVPDAYEVSYRSYDGIRFYGQGEFTGTNDNMGTATISLWKKKKAEASPEKKDEKVKDQKSKKDSKASEKIVKEEEKTKNEGKLIDKMGNQDEKAKNEGKPTDQLAKDDDKTKNDSKPTDKTDKKKDKAVVVIYDMKGDTVRNFSTELKDGFNRITWRLERNGIEYPGRTSRVDKDDKPDPPGGTDVLPGTYKIVVSYQGARDSSNINVIFDPRRKVPMADLIAKENAYKEFYKTVTAAKKGYDLIKDARTSIELTDKLLVNQEDSIKTKFKELHKSLNGKLDTLEGKFKLLGELKGIQRDPDKLINILYGASSYLEGSQGAPQANALLSINIAKSDTEKVLTDINGFYTTHWPKYKEAVNAIQAKIFKEFKVVKIE